LRSSWSQKPRKLAIAAGISAATLALVGGQSAAQATTPAKSAQPARVSVLRALNGPANLLDQQSLTAPQSGLPAVPRKVRTAQSAWSAIPAFPTQISDNVVGYNNGTVYSVTGWTGRTFQSTADMYSYTPGARNWKQLATSPVVRDEAAGAFIGGKLFITGGWGANVQPLAETDVYNPTTNKWATVAPLPVPVAAAAVSVLNGKLYLVGGCNAEQCGSVANVQVYDPSTNTWSHVASYPTPVDFAACGAISGKLYCAGGSDLAGTVATLTTAYSYDPSTDRWSRIADLPEDAFGAAYTAANGQLLVQNGAIDDALVETNQGFAYDPVTNSWGSLPPSLAGELRGGSGPGFYQIGGDPGQGPENVLSTAQVLAGNVSP
jgi:N-acetylneuraminic acid mutarotase